MYIHIVMPYSAALVKAYIDQLDAKEKQAYEIAKKHLGSSFSLVKSIGFQTWIKKTRSSI